MEDFVVTAVIGIIGDDVIYPDVVSVRILPTDYRISAGVDQVVETFPGSESHRAFGFCQCRREIQYRSPVHYGDRRHRNGDGAFFHGYQIAFVVRGNRRVRDRVVVIGYSAVDIYGILHPGGTERLRQTFEYRVGYIQFVPCRQTFGTIAESVVGRNFAVIKFTVFGFHRVYGDRFFGNFERYRFYIIDIVFTADFEINFVRSGVGHFQSFGIIFAVERKCRNVPRTQSVFGEYRRSVDSMSFAVVFDRFENVIVFDGEIFRHNFEIPLDFAGIGTQIAESGFLFRGYRHHEFI